jgi:hypothetical protein
MLYTLEHSPSDASSAAGTSRQVNHSYQGVTKRFCLSLLTNSALVYESKCGGMGGLELQGLIQWVQLCTSRDMEPK